MDLNAMTPQARTDAIVAMGREIGFDDVGVAPAGPHPEMARFGEWLEREYHGEMTYMFRHRRRRMNPERTMRGVHSVIMAALDYDTDRPRSTEVAPDDGRAWVSRYAWGQDYHDVIEARLTEWVARLEAAAPGFGFRHYVDHGPVLEKVFARYAGLGWMGKHTNLIHPERGSFFFLATVMTDLELAPGTVLEDRCGSCTACLDACPTAAFPEPYVLDARRCLSYLTIELPGAIPDEHRGDVGQQLFGCDICQDVCPWNRKPERPNRPEFTPRPGSYRPSLSEIAALTDEGFEERFAGTPIARRGREGLQRTARLIAETTDGLAGSDGTGSDRDG